jgi:hypothetical protein
MPTIPYKPENFGTYAGPLFKNPGELKVSSEELCWAAVTVGRRNWPDVTKHGLYSLFEIQWRITMLWANLVEMADGQLAKSDAFHNLDPSEKGSVSFFIGNTIAKLVTERLFDVSWLLHFDVYKNQLNPDLRLKGKPDFVGLDSSLSWIIMEAKGRTNSATSKLMDDSKYQTRCLRKINDDLPSLRTAVASYFTSNCLRVWLRDPNSATENAEDIELDPKILLTEYYKPFTHLYKKAINIEQQTIENSSFNIIDIEGLSAKIGIRKEIYEVFVEARIFEQDLYKALFKEEHTFLNALQKARMQSDEKIDQVFESHLPNILTNKDRLKKIKKAGNDGVAVLLGDAWSKERMMRQPNKR